MSVEITDFPTKFTEMGPRQPAYGGQEEQDVQTAKSEHGQGSSRGISSCQSQSPSSRTPRKSPSSSSGATKLVSCDRHLEEMARPSNVNPGAEEDCANSNSSLTPPLTDTGTPPYLRWAETLRNLLDDSDGVRLFNEFLHQEECADALNFWFACSGLKKISSSNSKKVEDMINIIFRKYIRPSLQKVLAIATDTRQAITSKVTTKTGLDQNVFDGAQAEVEAHMEATLYPNFLRSDIYLQAIQAANGGNEDLQSSSSGSSCVLGRCGVDYLPTVDENKELGVEDSPRSLPLTRKGLYLSQHRRQGYGTYPKMEAHAGHHLQGLSRLQNPYHAMYATCVPVSAQDSEQQSQSSGAHTDDAMSLTDGSVDGLPGHNNHQRYFHRMIYKNANLNKDPGYPIDFKPRTHEIAQEKLKPVNEEAFARLLIGKLENVIKQQDSQEKQEEQMKCLRKYIEAEGTELTQPLQEDSYISKPTHPHPLASITDSLRKMSNIPEDCVQSILDEHVSRVFSEEHTPSRSPPPLWPQTADQQHRCRTGNHDHSSRHLPRNAGFGTAINPAPSHPQWRYKDKDLFSTSGDSGTGHEIFEPDNMQQFTVVPPGKHGNHHHMAKQGRTLSSSPSLMGVSQGGCYPERATCHASGEYLTHPIAGIAERGERRGKDASKRSSSKKMTITDSGSSCVDSGVGSFMYKAEMPPALPPSVKPHERVMYWMLENDKYCTAHNADSEKDSSSKHRKSNHSSISASSPCGNRQGRGKKQPLVYNTSRSGSLDRGGHSAWPQPCQPFAQDPNMPPLPLPNTASALEEVCRRLEDDTMKLNKSKSLSGKEKSHHLDMQKPRLSLGKSIYTRDYMEEERKCVKKSGVSTSITAHQSPAEETVVGYIFSGEKFPYRTKLPGKNITLRQFKTLITKKGNYRYFFKKVCHEFGTPIVNEEVTDDNEVLPLWDGKIFGEVQSID